ncbi:MAG TPA: type II toxin-antitoxin system VapC family toxin [Bryobacteraceae bacterium]|nr:type II toxin-antitoxin system VapC family toxin [Bryobacteraceae bacterium]
MPNGFRLFQCWIRALRKRFWDTTIQALSNDRRFIGDSLDRFQEPEARRLATAIVNVPERHISTFNWLETMLVVEGRAGAEAAEETLLILTQLGVGILVLDAAHMQEAHDAWRRFGKGRHPAALNMGDCCAYAASRVERRPLLFKGNDLTRTDVEKAVW